MKLRRIVSGGQTGVDQAALLEARNRQIKTGGWAPRGWYTENGPQQELLEGYGLVECGDSGYKVRTALNVRDSDITIWLGRPHTPGYWTTFKAASNHKKSFFENLTPQGFRDMADLVEVINIAGNRLSVNAEGPRLVKEMFSGLELPGKGGLKVVESGS